MWWVVILVLGPGENKKSVLGVVILVELGLEAFIINEMLVDLPKKML